MSTSQELIASTTTAAASKMKFFDIQEEEKKKKKKRPQRRPYGAKLLVCRPCDASAQDDDQQVTTESNPPLPALECPHLRRRKKKGHVFRRAMRNVFQTRWGKRGKVCDAKLDIAQKVMLPICNNEGFNKLGKTQWRNLAVVCIARSFLDMVPKVQSNGNLIDVKSRVHALIYMCTEPVLNEPRLVLRNHATSPGAIFYQLRELMDAVEWDARPQTGTNLRQYLTLFVENPKKAMADKHDRNFLERHVNKVKDDIDKSHLRCDSLIESLEGSWYDACDTRKTCNSHGYGEDDEVELGFDGLDDFIAANAMM